MPQIKVEPDRAEALLSKLGQDAANAEWKEQHDADKLQSKIDTADSAPESWSKLSAQAVEFAATRVCPAWQVSDEEKRDTSQAIAEVLDHYFPGALEGFDQWHPLAKLCGVLSFVVLMRIDFQTGRIAPMKEKEASDASGQERRSDDSDNGEKPQRKDKPNATIGGG